MLLWCDNVVVLRSPGLNAPSAPEPHPGRPSALTQGLRAATEAVARALTPSEVVDAVAAQAQAALGVRATLAYRLTEHGDHFEVMHATGRSEEPVIDGFRFLLNESTPAGQVFLSGDPIWLATPEEIDRYPLIGELMRMQGIQAIVLLPMRSVDGRVANVLRFTFAEPRAWSAAQREFLTEIAGLCAPALERAARVEQEIAGREAAEASNRARDEFLAVLSHELRTPLTPIFGFAALLRRRLGASDPLVDEALSAIERGAQQELRLVNDLLDVSRVISGKLVLKQDVVRPAEVIEAALADVQIAATAKGIALTAELQPVATVRGDQERLRQAVGNLLVNAVKFTPGEGAVRISLEQRGDEALITVADSGIGIDPAFLPSVFERFSQGDPSSTRRHHGLGLGLAIVRHIVEGHGGRVTASSAGAGQGATFTITLPCMSAGLPAGSAKIASVPSPAGGALGGARILLVEDHEPTRQALQMLFEAEGALAAVAASADAALALLGERAFDLLVADIGLPDVDGYSLIRTVRSTSGLARLPALALTAYAGPSDRQDALDAGFDQHLAKPPDTALLLATLARMLRR